MTCGKVLLWALALLSPVLLGASMARPESVGMAAEKGEIRITHVGHGSLILEYDGKVVHVDPWSAMGEYEQLPKADLVLVTHQHQDHLDWEAINLIKKPGTLFVMTQKCRDRMLTPADNVTVMINGDTGGFLGFKVEAVHAYNLKHKRKDGKPYHPKGLGNGYVLTMGKRRLYISGDTELIPEMKRLGNVDAAFLCMNLPYTMSSMMAYKATQTIKPKVVYPYHYSGAQNQLPGYLELMKKMPEVKVVVLK